MFTKDEILAQLVEGANADKLAREFTEALNAAIQEKKTQDEEARKRAEAEALAKREKEERDHLMRREARSIVRAIRAFDEKFYPNSVTDKFDEDLEAGAFIIAREVYDSGFNLFGDLFSKPEVKTNTIESKQTKSLLDLLNNALTSCKPTDKKTIVEKKNPLDQFLMDNGLL